MSDLAQVYAQGGYLHLPNYFSEDEINAIAVIIRQFHKHWLDKNQEFYQERAVNSAYLTAKQSLEPHHREQLIRFIGSQKIAKVLDNVFPRAMAFMNTQLFFNPCNQAQKNYWHRDQQYHLNIEQQRHALQNEIVHIRIPLCDEPGIELIPGSHKRWDSDLELDTRLERNGRRNYEDLNNGLSIPLRAGDLLLFSGCMIHRGLYGGDRLAFDIIFCDVKPELLEFVDPDCLPDDKLLNTLDNPEAFAQTIGVLKHIKKA